MENEEKKKDKKRWLLILFALLFVGGGSTLLITHPWRKAPEPQPSTEAPTEQVVVPSETPAETEPAVRPEDDLRARLAAEGTDSIELAEAIELTGDPVEVNGTKTLTGSGSLTDAGLTGEYIIVINKDASLTIDGPDVDGTDAAPNGILVSESAKLDLKKGALKNIRQLGVNVIGEASVSGSIEKCGSSWMDIGKGAKVVLDGAVMDDSGSIGLNAAKGSEISVHSAKLTNTKGYILYSEGDAEVSDSELSGAQLFVLANGGKMSVKNSQISEGKAQGLITNYAGAELTVEGSTLENCMDYLIYNSGKMTVEGSEISGSGGYTVYNAGGEADITLKDTTIADSQKTSLYNRKDCTMQLENVTVKNSGGHALMNRAGTVTAKGFYSPDKVKSFTVRNDTATDTDLSFGNMEIEDFELAGSDNFCIINYGGKMVLKNGTVGVSSSSGIYIRDGEAEIESVKVLGVDGESLPGVQIGKDGIMTAVVTMTNVDITGAPRGITNYGTLTFNSGRIHDNKNSGTLEAAGGVNNFGTFYLKGGTISGNVAKNYGGGVLNQGSMEFSDGVIENNTAGGSGGGIIVSSKGTLKMSGGQIRNNVSGKNGGGIYNSGTVVMSAGTISGNKNQNGGYGGGVSNDNSFTMYYGVISGNVSSSSGGGLFNSSNGTMLLTGGSVINNRTSAEKSGGGIFNTGKLTLQGSISVSNNVSSGSGGGISNSTASNGKRGSVTISGGTYSGNSAAKSGGGIANLADMTINGGTIQSNTAQNYGGGLYTSEESKTTINGGTIKANKSVKELGGGVANRGYLSMTGGSITANISGGAAGGLGNFSTGTAILSGGSISSNKSTNGKGGGGIYNVGKLTLKNKIVITANTADGAGGAINNNVASTGAVGSLTIEGGTISGNKAATSGGAVCTVGIMTMSGGTLADNTAANNGGGVYCDEKGTVRISGGTISGNKCGKSGGGVFTNGSVTITGGVIRGNAAEGSGGALAVSSTASATVSGGSFLGNRSGNNGGGIYCGGSLTMSGGTVDSNTSASYGGGIFCASTATSSLTGGTISSNKNGGDLPGGGVFNTGKMTVGGSVEIAKNISAGSGGAIANNIASDGTRGQLTVTGGKFSGNEAGKSGGAILNLADMTISGGTFSGNKATNNGGVLYAETGSSNEIKGAVMENNTAGKSGGALFLAENALVSGCSISGNTADDKGGAIYVKGPAALTLEGSKIDQNVSADLGSAIMLYQSSLVMKDSDVFAGDDTRAVFSSDAAIKLDGTVNTALATFLPVELADGFKEASRVIIDTKGRFADGQVVLSGGADGIKATYDKSFTIVDLPDTLVLIEDGTLSNPNAGMEAILYDANGTRLASGSLAAMINRAESGQTVELIADAEIVSKTVISKDITLRDDGTAHTVTITSSDRGFSIAPGGKLTIIGNGGMNFAGGSTLSESAIYMATVDGVGGMLNISGKVSFSGFTGGAGTVIMNTSASAVTMDGTIFENNNAGEKNGGAVYNNGQMTLKNVVFRNNKAASGSGLFNYQKGTLTAENLTFEGNESTAGGGAAYNNAGSMTIDTASFTNNKAGANGGALQVYGGTVVLKDVTASGNAAVNYGQDLYLVNGADGAKADVTLSGGSFGSGTESGMKTSVYATCAVRKLDGKLTADIYTRTALEVLSDFQADSDVTLYLDGYADGRVVLSGDAAAIAAAVEAGAFELPELPANRVLDPDGTLKTLQTDEAEAVLLDPAGTEKSRGTFMDMVQAAASGETVKLIADAAVSSRLTITADITITDDGTARTITISAADRGFSVSAGGKLTIIGTANGGLKFVGSGTLSESAIYLAMSGSAGSTLDISGKVSFSGFTGGAGTVIMNTSASSVTMDGTVFENNDAGTKNGGAVYNNGQMTLKNVVFRNNKAASGSGLFNYQKGVLTAENLTFEGNESTAGGGAAYNNAGSMTLDTANFTNNKAGANGGALQVYGGTVVLKNVTASGNTAASYGKDLYMVNGANSAAANVTINGGSFGSGSGAGTAASVYMTCTGRDLSGKVTADIYTKGVLTLLNDFSAESAITLYLDGYTAGRAVLQSDDAALLAAAAEGVFTLPALPDTLELGTDGKLQAKQDPGPGPDPDAEAVLLNAAGEEQGRGTLSQMVADAQAGWTVKVIGNAAISGTVTPAVSLTLTDDGTVRTVTVSAADNGFVIQSGITLTVAGTSGGGLTFAGGSLTGSFANVKAGGTMNVNGKVTVSGFNSTSTTPGYGGPAVLIQEGTLNVDGTVFANNKTAKAAGAIYNYKGTVSIKNASFTGNKTTGGGGGAIYSNTGTLTVEDTSFTGNSVSANGGAIQVYGGTAVLKNVTASGNTAATNGADAYLVDGGSVPGKLTINGGSYTSSGTGMKSAVYLTCTERKLDGRLTATVFMKKTQTLELQSGFSAESKITLYLEGYDEGQAVLSGTASVIEAAVTANAFTLPALPETLKLGTDGTLVSNVYAPDPNSEAVLYESDGTTYAGQDGAFADMVTAAADGQIVELKKDVTIASMITLSKSLTIRDDGTARTVTVSSADRGITVSSGKTLSISGNGGLTFAGGSLTGAGIHVAGTLNVSGSVTFSGFSSTNGYTNNANGSAVYAAGTAVVNMNGTTFKNNISQSKAGGAIYNGGKMTLTNVTFTGNSAGTNGGAIFNYRGTMTLTNVTFTSNNAGTYGGAIHMDGGTGTLTNVTSSGNVTGNYGRDIYVAGSAAATLLLDGGSYTSGLGTTGTSKPCAVFIANLDGNQLTLNHKVSADIHLNGTLTCALDNAFATDSAILIALPAAQFKAGREVLTGNADVIAAAVNAGVFTTTNTAYVIDADGKLAAAPAEEP